MRRRIVRYAYVNIKRYALDLSTLNDLNVTLTWIIIILQFWKGASGTESHSLQNNGGQH